MSDNITQSALHLTHAYCGHGADCHCKCDDLPYRLRSGKTIPEDLARRAADEIERLRAIIEKVAQTAQETVAYVDDESAEYQRGMEDAGKAILYTLERPNA